MAGDTEAMEVDAEAPAPAAEAGEAAEARSKKCEKKRERVAWINVIEQFIRECS